MGRGRVHVNIWEIFSCNCYVVWRTYVIGGDVIRVVVRGEGSISGGSWSEREKEMGKEYSQVML